VLIAILLSSRFAFLIVFACFVDHVFFGPRLQSFSSSPFYRKDDRGFWQSQWYASLCVPAYDRGCPAKQNGSAGLPDHRSGNGE
jgi:hypothetical protein